MRVLVLGGTGNFGARIVHALAGDPAIELLAAGRHVLPVEGAELVRVVALDCSAPDFTARLCELAPGLVIHCVGPFQGQDYAVARASLAAGAHYMDLADGRAFVVGFGAAMDATARAAGRVAISGASTLPALSSAVVDKLVEDLTAVESIEVVIAPGQRAPRGTATLEAVFSYLGRPFPEWRGGRWRRMWGWMDLRAVQLDIGRRLAASCDVPDLALFPERYPGVKTVSFHAALESCAQHFALWGLAALRRLGLPLPVERWAMPLNCIASCFDAGAGEWGGMKVSVTGTGTGAAGRSIARRWELKAPAPDGPEIPCMAAILLARRMARGERLPAGAYPCMGLVRLEEFGPEFARWGITTRVEEEAL